MAQINSIFDVTSWVDNYTYKIYDPINISGFSRYCITPHTVTVNGSFSGELWGGLDSVDNVWIPRFLDQWRPLYPVKFNIEPTVRSVQFSEGYTQRLSPGINTNLLKVDLEFNGKSYQEILGISHFLDARAGRESFRWLAPSPYATMKLWICSSWSPVIQFHSNYGMSCTFTEVAA